MAEYVIQPSPTRTANKLHSDVPGYAEGRWTPAISCITPGDLSVSYTTQTGYWTRIGNLVFVDLKIQTSSFTHTTASGVAFITGIPLALGLTSGQEGGSLSFQGITKAGYTSMALITSPTNQFHINASGSGVAISKVDIANMPTGGTVILLGSLTYRI